MMDPSTCTPENPLVFFKGTWHFIVLAIWGGVANYTYRVRSGKVAHWSLFELAGDTVISGFSGTLAFALCMELHMSQWTTAATVGIAGHLGSRTVFLIEQVLRWKLRFTTDDGEPK